MDRKAYEERIAWFQEARFGMFIHWGVYAIPARGEWIRCHERISVEDYQQYVDEFDPRDYDPKAWARAWTTPPALFLADLASGEALPGAHVPLTASGELQMAGQAYSPDPSTLRAASGEVAYLRTAYGIVRMTYR